IVNHDVRIANHVVSVYGNAPGCGHVQEVCGLSWSRDGTLLASGGNDNLLCIWDARNATDAKNVLSEHSAAVKALAWCPRRRHVLASGGGTADRTIKTWSAGSGNLLSSTDTGSQVCSLVFSPHNDELLSSHGFAENQLSLWKFPTMSKLKDLHGHTA